MEVMTFCVSWYTEMKSDIMNPITPYLSNFVRQRDSLDKLKTNKLSSAKEWL